MSASQYSHLVKSERDRLSREDIEREAVKRLEKYVPGSSCVPQSCPLEIIVEKLIAKRKVEFRFDEELGELPGGRKIFGEFRVEPLTIRIDRSLERWGPRFRYTLAHELGHLALHHSFIGKGKFISREQVSPDTRELLRYGRMAQFSDLDWVEWQANEFASAMLLPKVALLRAIKEAQISFGVNRNIGRIILNDHPSSLMDAYKVAADLLLKFGISQSLIWKRLRALELIEDFRGPGGSRSYEEVDALFHAQS